jgi:hypothetical protein
MDIYYYYYYYLYLVLNIMYEIFNPYQNTLTKYSFAVSAVRMVNVLFTPRKYVGRAEV